MKTEIQAESNKSRLDSTGKSRSIRWRSWRQRIGTPAQSQGSAGWDTVAKSDGRGARQSGPSSKELRAQFGQHCREARIRRGLSQQEVAALSGISQSNITIIEHGLKNITLETMMRILRVVDRELARRLKGDLKARFGASMQTARKEAGLSQAQLAERAGVRTQYISRIETGAANVKLETVATMARAIGQDPNRLLDGLFSTQAESGDPLSGA